MFTATFLLASKGKRIFSNPFMCQNFDCRSVVIWDNGTPGSYMRLKKVHICPFFSLKAAIEWQNSAGCIEHMWTDVANVLKVGLSH